MTPWRKIETAPKNLDIDVVANGVRVPDVKWSQKHSSWVYWGIDGFESSGWVEVEGVVTHWMPIPELP